MAAILTAIRPCVKSHGASADVRAGYGVGAKLDKTSPKSVFAAVTGVLRAASADPATAREHGVLDTDIARLTTAAARAQTADTDQDDKRASAPAATRSRNAAAKNVDNAVKRIAAAGALEYATDAKKRAPFEALVPSTVRAKVKKKQPVAAE